jgi:hypothetical protein
MLFLSDPIACIIQAPTIKTEAIKMTISDSNSWVEPSAVEIIVAPHIINNTDTAKRLIFIIFIIPPYLFIHITK